MNAGPLGSSDSALTTTPLSLRNWSYCHHRAFCCAFLRHIEKRRDYHCQSVGSLRIRCRTSRICHWKLKRGKAAGLDGFIAEYDTIRYRSLTWTRKLSIELYLAHVARKKTKTNNASAPLIQYRLRSVKSEHLQYCHPYALLPCVLSKLFNFMIILCYVPHSFGFILFLYLEGAEMFTGNLSLLLIYFRCQKFMDMVYLINMKIYYSLVINSLVFSARQHIAHMLSALYAIARPSARLSHGWISRKRLKLVLWNQPHATSFCEVSFIGNFYRVPPERGLKQGRDGKNQPFSSFKRQYLENGSRYGQSYYWWLGSRI